MGAVQNHCIVQAGKIFNSVKHVVAGLPEKLDAGGGKFSLARKRMVHWAGAA